MPNLLFTVLQHVLEDPAHLTQSMESAVKMCWLRLSKGKTSRVTFKQLIEILAPLVHRDQQTFVQVMRTNVRLFRSDGQLLTALKDSTQRSEEAAKTATEIGKTPLLVVDPDVDTDGAEERREREAKEKLEKDKEEKEKANVVLTPRPSISASASQTPVSATSSKRQKTAHSDTATGGASTNSAALPSSSSNSSSSSSSSSSSNSMAVGLKTPSKSAFKDRRRKSMDVSTPHHVPIPITVAQAVVEELLGLAVSQWARLQSLNAYYASVTGDVSALSDGDSAKTLDPESSTPFSLPPAPCHLTIAEIMLVVGDLVSVVPGLATCVHR
jgi:hypothetical protein